jgi:DNA-binding transcriptional ArsR family regulator
MTPTDSPEKLLEILADPKSRAIIAAVAQERRSVSEISDYCDLPLSTSYRRVDELVENGVIKDALRIKGAGRHEQEYALRNESVSAVFRVDDAVDIRVSFDASDREDRMLRLTVPSYLD